MKNVVALIALAGVAAVANAQSAPMLPIGAQLRYEVSAAGGPWSSSVNVLPGTRVEWRVVVEAAPGSAAVALGQVYYQPLISGVSGADALGAFANGGRSGANPAAGLAAGMLSQADGNNAGALGGYGRVAFGNTTRGQNSSASNWNALAGLPDGPGVIRIAGVNTDGNTANNGTGTDFGRYASSIPGAATANQINSILAGVVSDNGSPANSWFVGGLDTNAEGNGLVIFRQALDLDDANSALRSITISSETGSARRSGGSGSTDDNRFMTWQVANDGTLPVGSLRVGYEIVPAVINVVPTPASAALLALGGLVAARRRRA